MFWGRWRPSLEEFKTAERNQSEVLNCLNNCSPAGPDSSGSSWVERLMTHFLSSAVFFHFSCTIICTVLKTERHFQNALYSGVIAVN